MALKVVGNNSTKVKETLRKDMLIFIRLAKF
jgi:hypothetical protein